MSYHTCEQETLNIFIFRNEHLTILIYLKVGAHIKRTSNNHDLNLYLIMHMVQSFDPYL